jgi:hypothetical protein
MIRLRQIVSLRGIRRRWLAAVCALVLGVFLILVIAHGVHDAFHDGEAGATVCVALTLLVAAGTTVLAAPPSQPRLVIAAVVPVGRTADVLRTYIARGSPAAFSPLRL